MATSDTTSRRSDAPMLPGTRQCSVLLFGLLMLLLGGCSAYQNVTAYFNTYYNAQKLFSEAESEIARTPQRDRDTNYFAAYNLPKTIEDKLDKVIEKNSKLIQYYPQSSWIDDAIVMIGKSYVYKAEGESAIRKFGELLQNFPTSSMRFEAKLWSAKALYQMKKEEEALKLTKELFPEARVEGKNDIMLETLLLEAQIYFGRGEYDQAAALYVLAAEVSGDNSLRAMGQFRLGVCYERLAEGLRAAEAYGRVRSFGPDLQTEFRSRLKEGTMYSRAGKYQHAFDVFEELRGEGLKADDLALVELETANTFKRMGDSAKAFQWYDFIDTTYARTDASAKSYYERALIFEQEHLDYANALKFYDKAKLENPSSEIAPLAQQKSVVLTNYFALRNNFVRYDSLLARSLRPDTTTADSLRGSSSAADSATSSGLAAGPPPDTLRRRIDSLVTIAPVPVPDSSKPAFRLPDATVGQLQPPAGVGEADTSDDEPHGRGLMSAREKERFLLRDDLTGKKGKFPVDSLSRDPFRKQAAPAPAAPPVVLSPDSLRRLLAQATFELAGVFYLEMGLTDSALVWYRRVTDNFPSSPLVPKALYAMGEIYRAAHDSAAVGLIYEMLLSRYDSTEYARQVKRLRGMEIVATHADSAEERYLEAERQLQAGKVREAMGSFRIVASTYPASPFAPKALYAIGWLFESSLVENDSAAAWYKKLIKEYPLSIYASAAQPKVAVKENPKSLSQYVKIKEILPIRRQEAGTRKPPVGLKDAKTPEEDDEELQQGRHGNRDDIDDNTGDDEEEPAEPDDSDDNN